jgi:hypothetical protein
MLALALVLEGKSRTEAAESCGMDRQTLRDWVHRSNTEGLAGLFNRPLPGRPPLPGSEQMRAPKAIVETGPDPATDGGCDGAGSICAWWCSGASACGLRSGAWARSFAGSALPACRRARATRRAMPKPKPHMKNFTDLVRAALPETAQDKPLEIRFQDEARVGQQGTLTRLWARKGSRPRAPKDCRHTSACIFGAVCPDRATGAARVMPHANTEGDERPPRRNQSACCARRTCPARPRRR